MQQQVPIAGQRGERGQPGRRVAATAQEALQGASRHLPEQRLAGIGLGQPGIRLIRHDGNDTIGPDPAEGGNPLGAGDPQQRLQCEGIGHDRPVKSLRGRLLPQPLDGRGG